MIERINERLIYLRPQRNGPPLLLIFNSIESSILRLDSEFLAGYWATRLMSSKEFSERFVKDREEFFKETLDHCLRCDIPCTGLVLRLASLLLNGRGISNFGPHKEYLDEDAIWHLTLGFAAPAQIVPATFITYEKKILEILIQFIAAECRLDHHGLLACSPVRLEQGPGVLMYLKKRSDGQIEVNRRDLVGFVQAAQKLAGK